VVCLGFGGSNPASHAGRAAHDACIRPTTLSVGTSTKDGRLSGVPIPSRRGRVWALPLGKLPVEAGGDLKIVWRATGRGPLRVVFRNPDGRVHAFDGPTPHLVSNFDRPGQEWGTIFPFDAPGCWTIGLARHGTSATIRITAT
jgi:hypothetical protein